MGNEKIFSAVNTKIRVLKANLLKDIDYINLMEKKNLKEQIKYLEENTIYGQDLESIENVDKLVDVEFLLRSHIIKQYEKILIYFNDEYKDLFKALLLRYEIEMLKIHMRVLERQESFSDLKKYDLLNKKHYSFDLEKTIKSRNLEDFINNLKGTIYYNALLPYKDENDEKSIFYMEMNLDILYFNNLYLKSKSLNKKDMHIFQQILGSNEDLLNIEWIYRGKKFYNLIPEEIINFTLSHGSVFKYADLKDMVYGDENHLKDKVLSTRYEFLFDSEKDIDLYMDRRIHRYLYYMFVKALKKSTFDITLSIAFIHLLDYEAEDIISILEAKRYRLDTENIKEYLIRKIGGSDK